MPQYRANDDVLQFLYVEQELTIAVSTVETGMAILQNNHLYRRNEFPFLLLLSTGLERVLKIVQHLIVFEDESHYRPVRHIHDLEALRGWVLANCFTPDYLTRPNMPADRDYLANDSMLIATFKVLSAFALADRYLYMDAIADPNLPDAADRWPSRQWAKLENVFIDQVGGVWPIEGIEDRHRYASRQLVGVIERLMRIVGRMFAFRRFGDTGSQLSVRLSHFTRMDEQEFGTVTYKV